MNTFLLALTIILSFSLNAYALIKWKPIKRTWPNPVQNPLHNLMEYADYLRIKNQAYYKELQYLKECFNASFPKDRENLQFHILGIYSRCQELDHHYDKIREYIVNLTPNSLEDNPVPSIPFTSMMDNNIHHKDPPLSPREFIETPPTATFQKQETQQENIMSFQGYDKFRKHIGYTDNTTLDTYATYLGLVYNPDLVKASKQYADAVEYLRQQPTDPESLDHSVNQ